MHFRTGGLRSFSLASSVALLLAQAAPAIGFAQAVGDTQTVVEEGQTLWQIAQNAGTDVETLARLNDLGDGSAIYVGQVLRLSAAPPPPPAPTTATHTVAEGEALWSIAAQYGVAVEAIVQTNELSNPDEIVLGSQLTIPLAAGVAAPAPADEAPAPAAAPAPEPVAQPRPGRSLQVPYTVQPGDTLNRIARQFNTTSQALAQTTGLEDPDLLVIGAVVKVPIPGRERVVQAGETLYGIAAQEKVDLGALIDFNEIADPQLIRVGETLLVPATPVQTTASIGGATSQDAPAPAAAAPAPKPQPTPAPTPTAAPNAQPTPTPAAPKPAAPAPTPAPTPPQPVRGNVAVPPGTPADGIVGAATKLLGKAYVFGGSGPSAFDCSGFVWYAAKQAGKTIQRGIFSQYNSGSHPARDQLKPGDLVFFQNTYMPGLSHNGIYIGNGQFIHAADEVQGVTVSSLSSAYWSSRWFGATRLS